MMKKKDPGKALDASLPARVHYEVGYGKPPVETRFRPGKSGNPGGRPKGARNKHPRLNEERLKDIILCEAYRTIKVRDGDRMVSVPIAQAVVRSLAVNAAKGQHRAQRLFSELLAATETANKRLHDEWLETAIGYKVDWEHELERRRRLGIDGPAPLPHPDDIEIDMNTGDVIINGPMTREQQARLYRLKERKVAFQAELTELRQKLMDNPDHEHREFIEADIARATEMLALLCKAVPDV